MVGNDSSVTSTSSVCAAPFQSTLKMMICRSSQLHKQNGQFHSRDYAAVKGLFARLIRCCVYTGLLRIYGESTDRHQDILKHVELSYMMVLLLLLLLPMLLLLGCMPGIGLGRPSSLLPPVLALQWTRFAPGFNISAEP